MLNQADQQRARFAVNDSVRFTYRRTMMKGTIARTNPTRAVVRADDKEFTVPYELMIPYSAVAAERVKRIESVRKLAAELLAEHRLAPWRFRFDHSTRRAGSCSYRDKTITLAFDLASTGSEEDILDTLLHEIAHALVGKQHNHDAVWKAKAIEIGGSGERTHRLQFAPPRWNVTCENRCWTHTAQQRNSKLICRTCGGKLVYSSFSTAG